MAAGTTGLYDGAITREKRRHFLIDLSRRLIREKPLGTIGAVIVLILLLVGIFADVLAPYGYNETLVGGRLESSSWQHWMGTDQSGRDLLSRVVYGARISMFVGLGVSILSTIISGLIGLISGYLGGKTDLVTQRFVDAWMCFPGIFIMITLMALVGPGIPQVIIVLGVLYGITGSRTVRGAVIGIKENVYVEAARSIGCSTGSLLLRHILPNIMAPMIIVFTSRMGAAILAEASISFLGYGIPEPFPSWGGMLNRGRPYMLEGLHLAVWPGLALSIVVWGVNMFGDGLRDLLDPRLRGGLGRYTGAGKKLAREVARRQSPAEQQ
ncbi:MAG: ABC transporter permease [Dehalococcoidales bacterium]|nr:ABC transporter permease [Dehalococcoidales bacterium]